VFQATYKGLKVSQFAELRKRLAAMGAECHVVPNRLLQIAVAECGISGAAELKVRGDTAVVVGGQDPVAVAKALRVFAKECPVFSLKGGVLGQRLFAGAEMERLAVMPPLPVVRAQLLGLLQAPMAQFVGVLSAKVASVLYVLQAYQKSKETPT
jgi:large subunit ribosomal protein L10